MNISSSSPIPPSADLYGSQAEATERQRIAQAVRGLNQANMFGQDREFTFSVDRATRRMIIHVIDRETHEPVMQLPPEYILRLWANLQKGQ
jgi:uncharacterized FlaG/YvyC family protein